MRKILILVLSLVYILIFAQESPQKYHIQLSQNESSVLELQPSDILKLTGQEFTFKALDSKKRYEIENFMVKVPKYAVRRFEGGAMTQELINFIALAKPGQLITFFDFQPKGEDIPNPEESNVIIFKIK